MKLSRVFLLVVLLVTVLMSTMAFGKTQITIWCQAFDPHVNGSNAVINAFMEKNPDIEITLEPQPNQADLVATSPRDISDPDDDPVVAAAENEQ